MVQYLFEDKTNLEEWHNRPASPIQKEGYKFFGGKVHSKLTHHEAQSFINQKLRELSDDDNNYLIWEMIEETYEELEDPDERDCYDIKKPPPSLLKRAIIELSKELSHKDLQEFNLSTDTIVDKMLEIRPSLSKSDS
jgi:hypothetical protein